MWNMQFCQENLGSSWQGGIAHCGTLRGARRGARRGRKAVPAAAPQPPVGLAQTVPGGARVAAAAAAAA
jgi:hypothetical protein